MYSVLAIVSDRYPHLTGRLPTCYSPVRRSSIPKDESARLACIRHAASVRPEPGSNSPIRIFPWGKYLKDFSLRNLSQVHRLRDKHLSSNWSLSLASFFSCSCEHGFFDILVQNISYISLRNLRFPSLVVQFSKSIHFVFVASPFKRRLL